MGWWAKTKSGNNSAPPLILFQWYIANKQKSCLPLQGIQGLKNHSNVECCYDSWSRRKCKNYFLLLISLCFSILSCNCSGSIDAGTMSNNILALAVILSHVAAFIHTSCSSNKWSSQVTIDHLSFLVKLVSLPLRPLLLYVFFPIINRCTCIIVM